MTQGPTKWSDGAIRGRRIRWLLGLAVVTLAVLILGLVGRGIISAWAPSALTVANELTAPTANLAGLGDPDPHVQRVDRRPEARPYLGITYVPVSPRLASRYGLEVDWGILVTAAAEGGPADRAGVRGGDILLFFDEQALSPEVSFLDLLWHQLPGTAVKLVVWREGRHFTTEAVLGAQ